MPTSLTSKDLAQRLSNRLVNFQISDAVINKLAERVFIEGLDIKKFDVCIYGICIDYFTPRFPKLDGFFKELDIARLEVFPYGIIDWDYFHVRVGFSVDELAGRTGGPGSF